jgi:hypothetical protein
VADFEGTYQPKTKLGATSSWNGEVRNRGMAVGKLAIIFSKGAGNEDWFKHHTGTYLLGSQPCIADSNLPGVVCGSLGPDATQKISLRGTASEAGIFRYVVGAADISSGQPKYINEDSSGRHRTLAWTEEVS